MKKNYVFWIVVITAILSFFHAVGTPLSYWGGLIVRYSENPLPHELANLFINNPLFRFWQIASIFITIYFIIKKVPVYITIIPAVLAFMGLPFAIILHFAWVYGVSLGDYYLDFLEPGIHLGLAVYSVAVLVRTKE